MNPTPKLDIEPKIQDLISEILEENYFCFFICLLDREQFSLDDRLSCNY